MEYRNIDIYHEKFHMSHLKGRKMFYLFFLQCNLTHTHTHTHTHIL